MSKKKDMLIAGADCEDCRFCYSENKNMVFCSVRNKKYYYGQYVPCTYKEQSQESEENQEDNAEDEYEEQII